MTLPAGRPDAYGAYGAASRALGTPRSLEYQVFSRVTGQLKRALDEDRPFAELAAALHDNHRLWTALTADLAHHDNALPPALKRQLVELARFSLAHGAKVLRREAEAGVLVEINTAVMRGLRGQLPRAEALPESAEAG